MKVCHFDSIPAQAVEKDGARGCSVRWLVDASDGAPNFAMRYFEIAPGGVTPRHRHDYEHEVFVLDGEGVVYEGDQEHSLRTRRRDLCRPAGCPSIPQHRCRAAEIHLPRSQLGDTSDDAHGAGVRRATGRGEPMNPPSVSTVLAVAAGGAVGSVLRYFVQWGMFRWWGTRFPYGTLLVNVLGCLALGGLAGWFAGATQASPEVKLLYLLLTVGVLGGFTTFSAFGLETFHLADTGHWPLAALYLALSNLLGVAAVWLGHRWATV